MSAFSVPEKQRFRIEGVPDEAILTSGIGLGRPGKPGSPNADSVLKLC